jgi:hypothetical protein
MFWLAEGSGLEPRIKTMSQESLALLRLESLFLNVKRLSLEDSSVNFFHAPLGILSHPMRTSNSGMRSVLLSTRYGTLKFDLVSTIK